jgi:hypothetical protein
VTPVTNAVLQGYSRISHGTAKVRGGSGWWLLGGC